MPKAIIDALGAPRGRSGQSLIESCLVIALLALLFMGMLQVSQLLGAREVLHHAAARGARAKTVGFNRWMVHKVVRVASIPNAGEMLTPAFDNENLWLRDGVADRRPGDFWSAVLGTTPSSRQYPLEATRIPEYLASEHPGEARATLDYERWHEVHDAALNAGAGGDLLRMRVSQEIPLWVPFHRAFYADDEIAMFGDSVLENHYPLYLEDQNW